MFIEFTLKAPPFSTNSAFYKRSFTRTKECREWGDDILCQLQKPQIQADLEALRLAYAASPKAGLAVNIVYHIPQSKFYTNKGFISRRSQDLSNVEKLLIDLVFDPRFDGRDVDGKPVRNLNMDDKLITLLCSEKVPTEREHSIDFSIELREHHY